MGDKGESVGDTGLTKNSLHEIVKEVKEDLAINSDQNKRGNDTSAAANSELETANSELETANPELQAANAELQAANVELEAAGEDPNMKAVAEAKVAAAKDKIEKLNNTKVVFEGEDEGHSGGGRRRSKRRHPKKGTRKSKKSGARKSKKVGRSRKNGSKRRAHRKH
jgi:hypothetical protein